MTEDYSPDNPPEEGQAVDGQNVLLRYAGMTNIAEALDNETLDRIADRCWRGYGVDEESRSAWIKECEAGMKLVKLTKEAKSFPWPDAANVKFPLMTTAAVQFASRAYPELIQGQEVVKCGVVGDDEAGEKASRATRISQHMSYQCLQEMEGWDEGLDRLLHVLPVIGMAYRKTFFDPVDLSNVSELCLPADVVVHYKAKSLEKAQRITHILELTENDIWEQKQNGAFLKIDLGYGNDPENLGDERPCHKFLEQHCFYDLDGDGYEEPYIVTLHEQTRKIVRIVARYDKDGLVYENNKLAKIKPVHYFTKFGFIPAPDGSFYDLGFAHLLGSTNELVNTLTNQLLDAGTLANTGGGFLAKGVRVKAGPVTFRPGEWKPVETGAGPLRDGIVPLPVPEPSPVLFQLLGMMLDAGKELASIKDILAGDQQTANQPATTTLALIEQGLKVFSAIYKRLYRSLGKEFKKLYRLNSIFLPDQAYFTVLDSPVAIARADYAMGDHDVIPSADPTASSDAQRLARAQALIAFQDHPGFNGAAIREFYLQSIRLPEPQRYLAEQGPPPPDPKLIIETGKLEIEQKKAESEIALNKANAILSLAKAEAEEAGQQMEQYRAWLGMLDPEQAQAEIKQQAQAALQAGANPEAVVKRIHDLGYGQMLQPPQQGQQMGMGSGMEPPMEGMPSA